MKKLSAFIFLISVAFGSYGQSFNETQDKFFVGYEVAVPTGFLTKTSWAGLRFDYRRMITPNFSLGIATSWNSFSQYVPRTTYQRENGEGALTADVVKEIYSVPITLSSHYYLKTNGKVVPYLGVGLGTQYSDQTIYMNIYGVDEYNWGFVARPEIGFIVPVATGGIYISAAYNYATNDNSAYKIDHLEHFAFTVGFNFGAP